jgi:cytoskeleton protein RodZ
MPSSFRVPPDVLTVRHKQGISLHDIAASTKIGVFYLQAIEDGEFDKLPGGIYTTSYIRQYARAIDYDENELLEYYYRAAGLELQPPELPPAKRHSTLFMWLARVLG